MGLHVVVEGEEGRELTLGAGNQLECRLGRDPKRSLVAREELLETEPGRGLAQLAPSAVADLDDLARRQHDLHRNHEIASVAIAGTQEGPAARADPPAHKRARV